MVVLGPAPASKSSAAPTRAVTATPPQMSRVSATATLSQHKLHPPDHNNNNNARTNRRMPSSSALSSSSTNPRSRSITPTKRPALVYPDANDVLILEAKQLPVLAPPTSSKACPNGSPSPQRSGSSPSSSFLRDSSRNSTRANSSVSASSSSSSSSSSGSSEDSGRRRGPSVDDEREEEQHDEGALEFSIEAELASAISEEDGGSFFKDIAPVPPLSASSKGTNSNSSSSGIRITSSPKTAASWLMAASDKQIGKNAVRAEDGEGVNDEDDDQYLRDRHRRLLGLRPGRAEGSSSSSPNTSAALVIHSPTASSPSQKSSSPQQVASQPDGNAASSSLAPSFLIHHVGGSGSSRSNGKARQTIDTNTLTQDGEDDDAVFSPSPFPSPPRTIPSLPPRVDISDFGIYSAAPSPTPSPISTPPRTLHALPPLHMGLHPHHGFYHSSPSTPTGFKGGRGSAAAEYSRHQHHPGAGGLLTIPDHLPPLNLPQTPLSLPAVLPEITLTLPASSGGGGGGGGGAGASLAAPLSLLSPPVLPPHLGRRHTDPGKNAPAAATVTTTAVGEGSAGGGGGLLPAPAEFGKAANGGALPQAGGEGQDTGVRLPSVPSFLGLNGAEDSAELERRLRLLSTSGFGVDGEQQQPLDDHDDEGEEDGSPLAGKGRSMDKTRAFPEVPVGNASVDASVASKDDDVERRFRKLQGCVSCSNPASVVCQGQTCGPSANADSSNTPFCSDCWASRHDRMNGEELRSHRTEDV